MPTSNASFGTPPRTREGIYGLKHKALFLCRTRSSPKSSYSAENRPLLRREMSPMAPQG